MKTNFVPGRNRKYGWVPDKPDQRDLLYKVTKPIPVPRRVDLRKVCSAIEDQGNLGSCTAQALAGHLEMLENMNKADYKEVSRLFIYYNERMIEGTIEEDSGASIRDGIKVLAKYGYCWEDMWPYNIEKFKDKPPVNCYAEAMKRNISEYRRLLTVDDMLQCLAEGYPIVFGISIYESFETKSVARTGEVSMPGSYERLLGGHAVLAVGHNTLCKKFIVRNSWGPKWGQDGYFTLPFSYVEKLADDFWTIRK